MFTGFANEVVEIHRAEMCPYILSDEMSVATARSRRHVFYVFISDASLVVRQESKHVDIQASTPRAK